MKKEITNKDLINGLFQITKAISDLTKVVKDNSSTISDLTKVVKDNSSSIENLAQITKKGFDNVDKRFEGVDKQLQEMKVDIFDLKQGHEDIQSKLSNIAYRFEMEELEKRVKKLEFKLGLEK
ncbi:MAG: hypothetical protein ISS02_01030 [Candidatus Portnoybacteria bacterium]|nr:hypothetical protein [Candidatus Portnoybacteria bacterium]